MLEGLEGLSFEVSIGVHQADRIKKSFYREASIWAVASNTMGCMCVIGQSLTCDWVNTPGFPVHHQLPELAQIHVIESLMPSNHLILCCALLLPPSIFPSIGTFSNESALCIRWPKYWSFSFSISPSDEYSGLISLGLTGLNSLLKPV